MADFPSSPGFATTDLQSNQPEYSPVGDSGKRQTRILGGHLWKAKVNFPRLLRTTIAPVLGFIAKQRGASFTIAIQPYDNASGTISGTVLTVGAGAVGDTTVSIDGAGSTDTMLAGDCFTLSGHTNKKVYMVTADTTASGGAFTALPITPPLIEVYGDGETFNFDGVEFTMAVDGPIKPFKTSAPALSAFSINLIEHLS